MFHWWLNNLKSLMIEVIEPACNFNVMKAVRLVLCLKLYGLLFMPYRRFHFCKKYEENKLAFTNSLIISKPRHTLTNSIGSMCSGALYHSNTVPHFSELGIWKAPCIRAMPYGTYHLAYLGCNG